VTVAELGRVRMYMLAILIMAYVASLMVGYSVEPSSDLVGQLNTSMVNYTRLLQNLLNRSAVLAFSYQLTGLVMELGPSLIPVFGIWWTSYNWIYMGIYANAPLPGEGIPTITSTILLSIVLAMPSSDSLLMLILIMGRWRSAVPRAALAMVGRWYLLSLIMVLSLILISASSVFVMY